MLEVMTFLTLLGDGSRFFHKRDVDFWDTRRKAAVAIQDLWADSTAPATVKKFLDSPTRDNAQAYLAWQEERLKRLRAAAALLDDLKREKEAPILYFSRPGCRWCALQEEELRGFAFTRVPDDSPLWQEYAVTATPTLVAGGKTLRGFTPRKSLLKALGNE